MRRPTLLALGFASGLLLSGAFYAFPQIVHVLELLSGPKHPANLTATEYERFESTPDGKPICPKCGRSDKVLKYLYGLHGDPPPEGVIGGGCAIGPKSPEYLCGHCDTRFGIASQGR